MFVLTKLIQFVILSYQCTHSNHVSCGIGVHWTGSIVLENIVDGSFIKLFENDSINFNSLTRECDDGSFYTVADSILYKYNPCINTSEIIPIDHVAIDQMSVTALAYNPKNDLLYAIYTDFIQSKNPEYLYSIDPDTTIATITFIGPVATEQNAEFDRNGILYSWSKDNGLVTINIYDASITIINELLPLLYDKIPIMQYLTFDPYDNNVIYGNDQDQIYRINKLDGSFEITSYIDNALRGFIMLPQDTCNQIICNQTICYLPTASPTVPVPTIYDSVTTAIPHSDTHIDVSLLIVIIVSVIVAVLIMILIVYIFIRRLRHSDKDKRTNDDCEEIMVENTGHKIIQQISADKQHRYKPVATTAVMDGIENKEDYKSNRNEINNTGDEMKQWFNDNVDMNEQDRWKYINILIINGFENLTAMKRITNDELRQMGITKLGHIKMIMSAVKNL